MATLPTIYNAPKLDYSQFTQTGQTPFINPWEKATSQEEAAANIQRLMGEGYGVKSYKDIAFADGGIRPEYKGLAEQFGGQIPDILINPQYQQFTEWSKNLFPSLNPEQLWMQGTPEIQLNVETLQRQMADNQRRYQEAMNYLSQTAEPGTPQYQEGLERAQRFADAYNQQAQQIAGFTGQQLQMQGAPGFQDVSGMPGGTLTEAQGLTPQQPVDVEAWRQAQGQPTTEQMQAPGYVPPEAGTPTPGPTQVSLTGAPLGEVPPVQPELGEWIRDPAQLALYREEELIRTPDGRIFLKPDVEPRHAGATGTPIAGAPGTPPGTLGTKVPSPEYLKYYTENEITRDPNTGEIFLKPGVEVRWGGGQAGATGLPSDEKPTLAVDDLTQFELGLQGMPNLAEGTPYGDLMGDYAQAMAELQRPITEIQNSILNTLMNQPSSAETLKQLKETYGVNTLNEELARLAKAAAPLEEALEKLPQDISERYKDVGISEAHQRRRLAVEAKPLTESINQITKARNLTVDQLKTQQTEVQDMFNAIMDDQTKENGILMQNLEFAQGNTDLQKSILDQQMNVAMAQIEAEITAQQPDITTKQFTDENGNVVMVGIDKKTGREEWRQDLGNIGKATEWASNWTNSGGITKENLGGLDGVFDNFLGKGRWGGQCAWFIHQVTDVENIGDSWESKQSHIDFTDPNQASIGDAMVFPTRGPYGHATVVLGYDPATDIITTVESNWNEDEQITVQQRKYSEIQGAGFVNGTMGATMQGMVAPYLEAGEDEVTDKDLIGRDVNALLSQHMGADGYVDTDKYRQIRDSVRTNAPELLSWFDKTYPAEEYLNPQDETAGALLY